MQESTGPERFGPDLTAPYRLSERFIAACAGGDLGALLAVLSDDVVGHVLLPAGRRGPVEGTVAGRAAVARNGLTLFGPASGITLVPQLVNGRSGLLAFRGDALFAALDFTVSPAGLIEHIEAVADPSRLASLSARVCGRRMSSG